MVCASGFSPLRMIFFFVGFFVVFIFFIFKDIALEKVWFQFFLIEKK